MSLTFLITFIFKYFVIFACKLKLEKGKKIGLALGGGAVLGAAHIGVLKALKEHEIEIGWISGTSIGALVASFHAFGHKVQDVEDLAIEFSWSDISNFSLSKYGMFTNNKISDFIKSEIGTKNLEDSEIPMAVIATDITRGSKVIIREGDLATAVRASTCLPGIFSPVEIDGNLLVDGGIVENVPISPLKDMGVETIIAVDLNTQQQYKRPENMIDVLLNTFHFTLATSAKLQKSGADILIEPDLSSFSRVNTKQSRGLINKGYEDAMKCLENYI